MIAATVRPVEAGPPSCSMEPDRNGVGALSRPRLQEKHFRRQSRGRAVLTMAGGGSGAKVAGQAAARPLARPGSGLGEWLGDLLAAGRAKLDAAITQEIDQRRLFLWLPAFFGAGILLYFAADREPSLWAALATTAILAGIAIWAMRREHLRLFRLCVCAAMVFAGLALATFQTWLATAPVVTRTIVGKAVAYIETVDDHRGGGRMLLRLVSIEGLAPDATPVRVRVTTRARPEFPAGTTIQATLRLLPPPQASEPGGYDFARDAWFAQIGGIGSVAGRMERAPDATGIAWTARINAVIDRARNNLTERIVGVVGGGVGAVTAALVTGKRGLIPEDMNEALRGAGIYHVVSISGLHMVLAAGLFMWSVRALLAMFPTIALQYPIKKWAAVCAIFGAIAYDIFAGSEVATERSLVMTLVLLGAVLFDRPALSMRNLAIAAFIVLIRDPQTLVGPSFQMSFAAVAAMIAAFERAPSRDFTRQVPADGLVDRARLVLFAMLVTTLVASLATDPFATFHFHRINPYGLIGNSLVLPVVEFIIMPMSVLGVAAGAFGLDAPAWWIAGQGVGLMMQVSHWVADLPGSTRYIPAFGGGAVLLMALAILWITIWQTWIRWAGLVFALAGVGLCLLYPKSDVLVDARGEVVAYRGATGQLEVMNAKANLFGVSQWLTADADGRSPRDPSLGGATRCDRSGCVGETADGRIVALVFDRAALAEDCGRSDILVTRLWVGDSCRGPDLVIDGRFLDAYGATELRFGPEGEIQRRSHRSAAYDRPWARARISAPPSQPAPENGDSEPDTAEFLTVTP